MGGVTSFGHAIVLDEVSSLVLVLPTPPLPQWELKPRSANIHFKNLFQPQLPRKHKNEGVRFFFGALPCEWPLPFHSYCTHTCLCHSYFHTTTHTKTHACTHIRSHEDVSYNGEGVTKTGLILALNIWCAEGSLMCVFRQDVPHRLSLSLSLSLSLCLSCCVSGQRL